MAFVQPNGQTRGLALMIPQSPHALARVQHHDDLQRPVDNPPIFFKRSQGSGDLFHVPRGLNAWQDNTFEAGPTEAAMSA